MADKENIDPFTTARIKLPREFESAVLPLQNQQIARENSHVEKQHHGRGKEHQIEHVRRWRDEWERVSRLCPAVTDIS